MHRSKGQATLVEGSLGRVDCEVLVLQPECLRAELRYPSAIGKEGEERPRPPHCGYCQRVRHPVPHRSLGDLDDQTDDFRRGRPVPVQRLP